MDIEDRESKMTTDDPIEGDSTVSVRKRSNLRKVIETGVCVTLYAVMGVYLEIFGPTLIDLKNKLNTNFEEVAIAVSGRSVGLFPGCILGGFLVDKFGGYCHLMIAVCLDLAAIVTALIPFSPSTTVMWVFCFIGGLGEAVNNVAAQSIILNIWLQKSATPMILLHMGYGIGSFIIPLYTNPFLAVERPEYMSDKSSVLSSYNYTTLETLTTVMPNTTHLSRYIKESSVEYSFFISASIVALLSIVFYIYQFNARKFNNPNPIKESKFETVELNSTAEKEKQVDSINDEQKQRSILQMLNPATCTNGRFWYGVQILVIAFFFCGNAYGGERVIGGFLRTFSIDQLGFNSDEATYLNTSFWISFTLGRLIFAILARWLSVRVLIMLETGGLLITTIIMNVVPKHSQIAYWILVQPLAFFLAPTWPTGITWIDFHIELTGLGMALTILGGSIGGIIHLRIIGYLYEKIGPQSLLYQTVAYGALHFILASLFNLVGSRYGNRFSDKWLNKEIYIEETQKKE